MGFNRSWSRRARRFGALSAAVLLSCCSAFPPVASIDQARARLTGMTGAQVGACLGQPGTAQSAANGRAVWTYTPRPDAMSPPAPVSDPSQASFGYAPFAGPVGNPAMAAAVAPPPPASCMVVLTFADGRVAEVSYTGPDGGMPIQPQACGALVGRCMP